MAKITLSNVLTLLGINSNFQKVKDELNNKVLYRNNPVGEPNTMETPLDMNGQRVFNLPLPLDLNEPARLADIANNASATALKNDLANTTDSNKGAALVGYNTETVKSFLDRFNYSNGTYRIKFSGGGQVFAFGRNSDNSGTQFQGLQIGGGDVSYGSNGVFAAPDGHYSWTRLQPTGNESTSELVIYNTSAQGIAQGVNATNQVNRISGSLFDSTWVGKKFYFNSTVYEVATFVNTSQITVQMVGGGGVSFSSTFNDTFNVARVNGSGICNVVGNNVIRVSGDPFIAFISSPFKMKINGSPVTVSAFTDTSHLTIAETLNLTNVAYEFSTDINNQLSTFRVQKTSGSNEENLSVFARYDGYHIRSFFSGSGKTLPIFMGNSSFTNIATYANGDTLIGGTYGSDAIRVLGPSGTIANRFDIQAATAGFSPAWRARGTDTNVGIGLDTQGTGDVVFTSASFGTLNLRVRGDGTGTLGFGYLAANGGFRAQEGSNKKQGTAVLIAGTVVVANTSVTANSRIFLTSQQDGGSPGFVRVSSRIASTSFTITSSSGTDTSTIAYQIFEPA